jgi:hypothetical protein
MDTMPILNHLYSFAFDYFGLHWGVLLFLKNNSSRAAIKIPLGLVTPKARTLFSVTSGTF